MVIRRRGQRLRSLTPMIFGVFFLVLFSSAASANFKIPEQPDGYVTDHAALLSPSTRNQLEAYLNDFEAKTSTQIAVAIFPSLEGGSLEDISIRLAQKWKIGQKGRNNGVLFLIFKEDRKIRIEVGYGLEGVLTDALSSQIIRNEVAPYFRMGDYASGVIEGVKAICTATQGEYQALPAQQNNDATALVKVIGLLILIILILDFVRYGVYRSQHLGQKNSYSFFEWFFLFAIFWLILRALLTSRGSSSWSSRGGGGGYSGGGFSGGGGGSFGGGGASGRW